MSYAPRHLQAVVLLTLSATLATLSAVSAQVVAVLVVPQPVRDVQIEIQSVDVTPDELAKAEQAAAVPPVTAAALAAQLQTALVGPGAHALRAELAKTGPNSSLDHPVQLTTHDGVPTSFSTSNMTIIPGGGTLITVTTVSVEPSIQPDGSVAMKMVGKGTPTVAVSYTAASGRLAAVMLPPSSDKRVRLVFLTAWVVSDLPLLHFQQAPGAFQQAPDFFDRHSPDDMNAYPLPGSDPNKVDQMQIHSPDVRDSINTWSPPMVAPPSNFGSR